MKTLFKSEKGAVSVFLILILVVVFIFNAVLIDYARIFIAEKQTERAAKTGVRSVMSSFDTDLVRYGLFGLNGDQNAIFKEVVEKNLPQKDADGFQFVDTTLEESTVSKSNDSFSIGNLDVFEEQVLQNMKYMAPIEFTKVMIDHFKMGDLQEEVANTSAFIDVMSKIEPLYNAREEALDQLDDEVGKLLLQIKEGVAEPAMVSAIKGAAQVDISQTSLGIINVLEDIPAQADLLLAVMLIIEEKKLELDELKPAEEETDEEKEARTEKKEELEKEIKELEKLVENYKKNSASLSQSVHNHYNGLSNGAINKVREHLELAIKKNNEIKVLVDKAVSERATGIDEGSLVEMYLDPNMMKNWQTLFNEVSAKVDDISTSGNSLRVAINKADWKSLSGIISFNRMREDLDQATKQATELHKDFKNKRKRLPAEKLEQKEAYEKEAEKVTKDAQKEVEDAVNFGKTLIEEDQIYEDVHSNFTRYKGINKAIEDEAAKLLKLDDYNKAADSAMGIMDSMMSAITGGLTNLRNELYVNEYILKNFNSKPPYNISFRESYLFDNKEVEYIIYGIPAAYGNYAAAYSQLFGMRFAIHAIGYLMSDGIKALGHPALIFIAVVSLALADTIDDMVQMTELNEEIEFFPRSVKTKIGAFGDRLLVDYRDHIRFFLLTNGRHENKMLRTQAVIEHKTGAALETKSVQVVGEVKSSVKLWFLPGVAEMLGDVGLLDGKVVDKNRYEFTKKAAYSY